MPTPSTRSRSRGSFLPEALRRILHLLSPRARVQLLVLHLVMLAAAALEMVGIGAIPAFVALLSDPDRLYQLEIVRTARDALDLHEQAHVVLVGAVLLVAFFFGKNVALAGVAYAQNRFLRNSSASIARRLFRVYLASPYPFHLSRNSAELLRNVTTEAQRAIAGVLAPILTFTREGLVVTAIAGLLILVDPFVSLATLLALGGSSVVFYRLVRRKLNKHGQQEHRAQGRLVQAVNESLGAIKEIKVLGRERLFQGRVDESLEQLAKARGFSLFLAQLPRLYLETVSLVGVLLVTTVFVAQGRGVQEMLPLLALLVVAILRLIPSFNQLTIASTWIRFHLPAVDAIYTDLRSLEPKDRPESPSVAAPEIPRLSRSIQLEGVSFRYPGGTTEALRTIDLTIPAGAAVAFVGPTGAGKTTLVDIILGLLQPTRGRVLVDGREIGGNVGSWQRQIGYVPQQIYLSDDTLRRNIALGCEDREIEEEQVLRAVRDAQLEPLLRELPNGLDSELGERGGRLSGGQRQRVAIARTLYHDPPVLVLDEATSSLDTETESYVMEAIRRLRGDRTLVIIAHRLSTVRDCDRLFYLCEGRLEAAGSFEELVASNDRFRSMAAANR